MPAIDSDEALGGGYYYHIYNRGINKQQVFFNQTDYRLFLKLIRVNIAEYSEILSYALIPNHFHLIIWIKDQIVFEGKSIEDPVLIGKIVSEQFRRMFIRYSMTINKSRQRTGSLFSRPFRRNVILGEELLKYKIFYTHYNPIKHGICNTFEDYLYSSYKEIIKENSGLITKSRLIQVFGSIESFREYHTFELSEMNEGIK